MDLYRMDWEFRPSGSDIKTSSRYQILIKPFHLIYNLPPVHRLPQLKNHYEHGEHNDYRVWRGISLTRQLLHWPAASI